MKLSLFSIFYYSQEPNKYNPIYKSFSFFDTP